MKLTVDIYLFGNIKYAQLSLICSFVKELYGYFGGKAGYMQAIKELEEAIYADEAV